jgi:glycine oxidase
MRVRVLGAGIVGLSAADELLRRGHDVTVVDPSPGRGASHAAAGMLCPSGETWHGEEELLRLGRASALMWPGFAALLGVPLARTGTLLAAADAGDLQEIERRLALLDAYGVIAQSLTRRELMAREPRLGRVAGGAWLPDEHSVDPRAVVAALRSRLPVVPAASETGWDVTVLATGAHLPAPYSGLVRPVRGEILRVRCDDPPGHVVRGLVRGESVYVVPRADSDEVVVGATSEEHDEAPVATVGGVRRLLENACRLVPGLDRAEFVEAIARDRPGSPDNLPLVGTVDDGVVLAAGHYRHGVLLAPLTAQLVADHLETGVVEPVVDPRRFVLQKTEGRSLA